MESKLMLICLLVALASLIDQARADCLSVANEKLKTDVEIPQFAKEIEQELRKSHPVLANLPLIELLKSNLFDDSDVADLFKIHQLESGIEECGQFIKNVGSVLETSGCQYDSLDLEEVLEDNVQDYARINEIVGYMGACLKV